jgi:uncharacterized protein YjeT (DUF2065 family)
MLQDIVTALGLVLVIEGMLYALMSSRMRALMKAALDEMTDSQLRAGGLAAMALGVVVVWLAR